MEHYLITRFNLKNKNWDSQKGNHALSEEWLDERFTIFEKYCLPSVENQTNTNFRWLVCFDVDTPKQYRSKIEDLKVRLAFFTPIFIDGFQNLEKEITTTIKDNTKQDFIISTRLDNDDILHKDFIQTIQKLFRPKNAVINLNLGYQLGILNSNTNELRLVNMAFNPFISVISSKDNFESVLSREHLNWSSHDNQIINKTNRLWIQLVHSNNVSNAISKISKKTTNIKMEDFGLSQIPLNQSKARITIYNVMMLPHRLYYNLKESLKTILKN